MLPSCVCQTHRPRRRIAICVPQIDRPFGFDHNGKGVESYQSVEVGPAYVESKWMQSLARDNVSL